MVDIEDPRLDTSHRPLAERLFSKEKTTGENEVAEREEDAHARGIEDGTDLEGDEETSKQEDERHTSEKDFKPVFLRGLFRLVFLVLRVKCLINDNTSSSAWQLLLETPTCYQG